MVRDIVGLGIVALVYLCFIIVIFAPTIYAAWLYLVTRKFTTKRKGMARLLLYTFVINAIIAYFLAHLAFNYFLGTKTEERESSVTATMQSAVASQKNFFASHGRYYNVGPVRGPYQNEYGLNVEKDVILFITPTWDKQLQRDNFQAYAVHVWGKTPLESTNDGKLKKLPADSEESIQIRSKLLNSVK
ncbi:MAG TPA: hypothetical protein VMC85_13635 [Desulfomonilaceae bacterium]|nr:hypothetical protein [Desulfomonilaceae bacterium]